MHTLPIPPALRGLNLVILATHMEFIEGFEDVRQHKPFRYDRGITYERGRHFGLVLNPLDTLRTVDGALNPNALATFEEAKQTGVLI